MHNPVVFHVERELHRLGWTTLRFNFRGVGASDGTHDEGQGEIDDIGSAVAWTRGLTLGRPLYLIGYSFGSLCGLRYLEDHHHGVDGFTAIGLPVREYELGDVSAVNVPIRVVQGSQDEFGEPDEVARALESTQEPARVFTVKNASHLFPGQTHDAATAVVEAILSMGAPTGAAT
jgi:alpha/beta superfamily hydrolase